jgi:hypothetical protein
MRNLCLLSMIGALFLAACAGPVGSVYQVDAKGARGENASPNKLTLADGEGVWNVEGIGPSRRTTIDETGSIETLQQGTTPRDAFIQLPDGTRLSVSSGTDVGAQSVTTYSEAGAKRLEIVGFNTSASEPAAQWVEAIKASVPAIVATTQAQRDAVIAALETQGEAARAVVEALRAVWAVYAPTSAAAAAVKP